eukprot:gb/GFBE01067805.1/.p1 GENE.gb/GFBE01067805.1/~~gb/GFBE01067805.1/.p1  ORF type:complete len:111 (+),score=5.58 gb/GFBE01067805.1/:1-333(+)
MTGHMREWRFRKLLAESWATRADFFESTGLYDYYPFSCKAVSVLCSGNEKHLADCKTKDIPYTTPDPTPARVSGLAMAELRKLFLHRDGRDAIHQCQCDQKPSVHTLQGL